MNNPMEQKKVIKTLSQLNSNYSASVADWQYFLSCWAKAIDPSNAIGFKKFDLNAIKQSHPELPASYLNFIEATGGNGWLLPGDKNRFGDSVEQIYSVKRIGKLKAVNQVTWKAWNDSKVDRVIADVDYYNYSNQQDVALFRDIYLDNLLAIGDLGGGAVIAINPMERTIDGEWEAWYLSTRLPGALRFKTFAELMQILYFMDIYPDKDALNLTSKDFVGTCAEKIYPNFRGPN